MQVSKLRSYTRQRRLEFCVGNIHIVEWHWSAFCPYVLRTTSVGHCKTNIVLLLARVITTRIFEQQVQPNTNWNIPIRPHVRSTRILNSSVLRNRAVFEASVYWLFKRKLEVAVTLRGKLSILSSMSKREEMNKQLGDSNDENGLATIFPDGMVRPSTTGVLSTTTGRSVVHFFDVKSDKQQGFCR